MEVLRKAKGANLLTFQVKETAQLSGDPEEDAQTIQDMGEDYKLLLLRELSKVPSPTTTVQARPRKRVEVPPPPKLEGDRDEA